MLTTAPAPTPLIDWHVLGQVLVISLGLGVALVTLFSLGVTSMSLTRRSQTAASRALGWLGTTLSSAAVVAVLGWGFYIITQKG